MPEPAFAGRVFQARQLICGQYSSWAAEMFMVHLPVAGFFRCPDPAVGAVEAGLARVAEQSRRKAPQFSLSHRGVATVPQNIGNIFLDFATEAKSDVRESGRAPLDILRRNVNALLQRTLDVIPEWTLPAAEDWPHLMLLHYAKLPPAVFKDAVDFARAVVADLKVPDTTHAWKLLLVKFESAAAGDAWGDGRWAVDLRWTLVSSYAL